MKNGTIAGRLVQRYYEKRLYRNGETEIEDLAYDLLRDFQPGGVYV